MRATKVQLIALMRGHMLAFFRRLAGLAAMKRWFRFAASALVLVLLASQAPVRAQRASPPAAAAAPAGSSRPGGVKPWPRVATSGNTTLAVYQPQLDAWDGFKLAGRAAVGATLANDKRTRYGVIWLEANTLVDKGRRIVTIDRAQIVKSDFPSASAAEVRAWQETIRASLEGKSRTIALDELLASLEAAGAQRPSQRTAIRNPPPRFVFSAVPAILIPVEGEPVYRAVKGTSLQRVVNTRPLLLRDRQGEYYLKVFDGWMSARDLNGPWGVAGIVPAELNIALGEASKAHLVDPLTGQSTPDSPAPSLATMVPAIHVATAPTELVVTDGEPRYAPIAGTRLLYVENTTGNVFKDTADSRTYVLVSGRWFRAPGPNGPWEFVAATALPADFARIPDNSLKENVKAAVAGTAQAREAAVEATVPQTAAVKIAGTTMDPPQIDGEPVLKPITGTSLQYVANSSTPIIWVPGNTYYAVQNGVWFSSATLPGPWGVATSVPAVIYSIPPGSPLYYVTFVRIYGVSDGVVYVGYTPGYQGAVVDPASGVVVYGTGYTYSPWVGSVWYGTPVTYGYAASVAYTPWTGWALAFGLGWAWGASTSCSGWGWGPYPHWGAWSYPAYAGRAYGPHGGAVGWGARGWAGYTGNIYSQWGKRATVARGSRGFDAWTGNSWASRVGSSYNSRTGVASAGQRGGVRNVYSGNFAAGARGVAKGPRGNVAAGARGVAGGPSQGIGAAGQRGTVVNPRTGQSVSGSRGVVANRNTGQVTGFSRATGSGGGTVARAGNNVYAGRDGNVYRNSGSGWEQRSGNGWTSASQPRARTGELDRERGARQSGDFRAQNLQRSSQGMQRSYGGARASGGGRRAGGGGRRR
jgi:hypothetical protein